MKIANLSLTEDELEAVFLALIHRGEMAARNVADHNFRDYWEDQAKASHSAIKKCSAAYDKLEPLGDALEKSAEDSDDRVREALQVVRQKIMNSLIWTNGETADHLDKGKSIAKLVGQAQGLIDAIGYVEQVHFDYEELPL